MQAFRRNTRVVVACDVHVEALLPWNRVTVHEGATGVVVAEKPLIGGHVEVMLFETGEVFKLHPHQLRPLMPAVTRARASLW